MRIFVYGTLQDAVVLARKAGEPRLASALSPALLRGHKRALLRQSRYPTLRRDPNHVTDGAMAQIGAFALRRLNAYEGPRYLLRILTIGTPHGPRRAGVWIAQGSTRVVWPR